MLLGGALALCSLSVALIPAGTLSAGQATPIVAVDADDIGGRVTSVQGPEVGVWVIAETTGLPTRFSRIVSTDDEGRYLLPDLPKASYSVWVRGYGLVDSPKVTATPGSQLDLTAIIAPTPQAAAQYYPANYWYSLVDVPPAGEFPGTGESGNGIPESTRTQSQYVNSLKASGCSVCHQMGNKATREIPAALGRFESSVDAWTRRLVAGQAGGNMGGMLGPMGRSRALRMYADWTDRIAAGAVPPAPPRPQGIERHLVVTNWDYAEPHVYVHDAISTDKRQPTVNANGPIYGAPEVSADKLYVLDPVRHVASEIPIPLRDPETPHASRQTSQQPSVYWGDEVIWSGRTNPHSSMFDRQGRLWTAATIRGPETAAFCREGSDHPSAKLWPIERSGRQLNMYDPKTGQFTLIDTCFMTHHLQFAENDVIWFSMVAGDMVGWFDVKVYEETKDERRAQGWTALVVDTNGNGRRDEGYVEPNDPVDPARDTRFRAGFYSVIESPVDQSIWGSMNAFPGAVVRLVPGAKPPATALTEIFEAPFGNPRAAVQGYTPRGLDIDRNGVVWTNLSGSGHLASFDRRKCTGRLNGPEAVGQHCPEGWTLYALPGPQFAGVTEHGSAEASYLNWVDQWDTSGMGANTPFAIGNGSDSLHALDVRTGAFIVLRVPYPMGFYAKGMDGRIDDPDGGWKGRGLWASSGTRAPWHIEGGKGQRPKITKFQMRPNPLAR
ncbi:MAG: carboxypeptidase regulatory-like domain-containing protein [Acidimicrobiia bacterium]|nr:carboxypeptidase regulatory-like domain-containing protein [Acidimicrobiia bacterium]